MTAASDEAREAVATFTMANAQVAAHQDEERTLRTAEQTYVAFLERWRLDPRFLNDPGSSQLISKPNATG